MKDAGRTQRKTEKERISMWKETDLWEIMKMVCHMDMGNIIGRMEAFTEECFIKVISMGKGFCLRNTN